MSVNIDDIILECSHLNVDNKKQLVWGYGKEKKITNDYDSLMTRILLAEQSLRNNLSLIIEKRCVIDTETKNLNDTLKHSLTNHLQTMGELDEILTAFKEFSHQVTNDWLFIRSILMFNEELRRIDKTSDSFDKYSHGFEESYLYDRCPILEDETVRRIRAEEDDDIKLLILLEIQFNDRKDKCEHLMAKFTDLRNKKIELCSVIRQSLALLEPLLSTSNASVSVGVNSGNDSFQPTTATATESAEAVAARSSNLVAEAGDTFSSSLVEGGINQDGGAATGPRTEGDTAGSAQPYGESPPLLQCLETVDSVRRLVSDIIFRQNSQTDLINEITKKLCVLVQLREDVRERGKLQESDTTSTTSNSTATSSGFSTGSLLATSLLKPMAPKPAAPALETENSRLTQVDSSHVTSGSGGDGEDHWDGLWGRMRGTMRAALKKGHSNLSAHGNADNNNGANITRSKISLPQSFSFKLRSSTSSTTKLDS